VRDSLVKLGVDSGRLEAKGYGQDKPLAPNVSAANRARNRRVQIIIKEKAK
jgi:outer membrane protein OmpA-like peptidoglycan-associated protein